MIYGGIKNNRAGFTIVELLVVMVVIAILAAISTVVFNGVQERARASSASQALVSARQKIELWKIDNADAAPESLSDAGINTDANVSYQYKRDVPLQTYCITATVGTTSYYIDNTSHTSPTKGVCPGHGLGGVAPITNLAQNPRATGFTTTQNQLGWRSDRYGNTGIYSVVSGASDGPLPSLNTYVRYTFTQEAARGRGFHHAGNTESAGGCYAWGYPVEPGETYTLSSYFRSSDGQGFAQIKARFCGVDGAWLAAGTGTNTPIANSGWIRTSTTVTAPPGAVRMNAQTQQEGTVPTRSVGDTIDGTGLMVTKDSATYSYADGNSPGWIWNGTPNLSTSTGSPQ